MKNIAHNKDFTQHYMTVQNDSCSPLMSEMKIRKHYKWFMEIQKDVETHSPLCSVKIFPELGAEETRGSLIVGGFGFGPVTVLADDGGRTSLPCWAPITTTLKTTI